MVTCKIVYPSKMVTYLRNNQAMSWPGGEPSTASRESDVLTTRPPSHRKYSQKFSLGCPTLTFILVYLVTCKWFLNWKLVRSSRFRPPDICVGGHMFYWDFSFFLSASFFLSFFDSYLPSSLNGTQSKPATCSEMSAIWECVSEIWGIPSPYKSGSR